MNTCIMCDKKVNEIQYVYSDKSCSKCLKEPRFMMEVEWDGDGLEIDYDIWCHDDLDWLTEKFTTARDKGFEVSIGSCPKISILSVKDTHSGENITKVIQTIINEGKEL